MRPDPFCDPGDGQEPDGSLPPAEAEVQAEPEPAQGLFLCLPAGTLDTDRFAQSGPAADMPPDPLLATIIDTVTGEDGKGLGGLSDDQLVGVIAAGRRLESTAGSVAATSGRLPSPRVIYVVDVYFIHGYDDYTRGYRAAGPARRAGRGERPEPRR